ncbi:sorbitol dehydrogenase-like [Octopus sinensis]|uniref:Sorbitol dehydrogenase-like n=1 Tax=Octopus sinensis TaxID=2607531 RepID=A0A6P7U4T2_9MOLL|nr:sorbitol dehydrogenase-like [Octopus sinensis]
MCHTLDVVEDKVEFAKKHGADCGVVVRRGESPTQISDRVVQELGGMADVSIDCCGISSSIETLVNVFFTFFNSGHYSWRCSNFGWVIVSGGFHLHLKHCLEVFGSQGIHKYLQLVSSCDLFCSYPKAIDLIQSGKIDVSFLITHRYSIDQYQKAFDNLSAGIGFKTVINL